MKEEEFAGGRSSRVTATRDFVAWLADCGGM